MESALDPVRSSPRTVHQRNFWPPWIRAFLRKGRNDEEAPLFYIGRAFVRVFSIHTSLGPGKTALDI